MSISPVWGIKETVATAAAMRIVLLRKRFAVYEYPETPRSSDGILTPYFGRG